jgi:putative oxidoreductase
MLGIVFMAHGCQKTLGLFGGSGLMPFVSWTSKLGVPAYLGYAAPFAELIGGILLFLGVYAELGALMVASFMISALYLVHLPHGFFIQNNGFEYVLTLLVNALVIIISGPGYFALSPFKR